MMSLKAAALVMLVGGFISAFHRQWETACAFLAGGFGLIYCFETDIQWTQPLDKKHLFKELTENKWHVTAVGQFSQFLSIIFMILIFIVHFA